MFPRSKPILEVRPPGDMQVIGENYHVYNRGAHKVDIFSGPHDYDRFVSLLFVANDIEPIKQDWIETKFWNKQNREEIVEIFAYCLMPNHFHIGIREVREKGIERFMRKLMTAYTMYYNLKYDHSGTLFQGKYKHKHIDSDEYLRYVIEYIHLNPFGIEEPDLIKVERRQLVNLARKHCKDYKYSSYRDYLGTPRQQNAIIHKVDWALSEFDD